MLQHQRAIGQSGEGIGLCAGHELGLKHGIGAHGEYHAHQHHGRKHENRYRSHDAVLGVLCIREGEDEDRCHQSGDHHDEPSGKWSSGAVCTLCGEETNLGMQQRCGGRKECEDVRCIQGGLRDVADPRIRYRPQQVTQE